MSLHSLPPLPLVVAVYGLSYIPFSALSKLSGATYGPAGILTASVCASAVMWLIMLSIGGWWSDLRRGLNLQSFLSGFASVGILFASIFVYGEPRLSIILPLLLMKGGVLLMSPAIDRLRNRDVDLRSGTVVVLAALAILVGFAPKMGGEASAVAVTCAALYLLGYGLKLPTTDAGKADPWPFLVAEMSVTALLSVALTLPVLFVLPESLRAMSDPLPLLSGAFSTLCGFFGGLILLHRGGHTLLVSLSRCASVIAGITATVLLGKGVGSAEMAGAGLMCLALWIGVRK